MSFLSFVLLSVFAIWIYFFIIITFNILLCVISQVGQVFFICALIVTVLIIGVTLFFYFFQIIFQVDCVFLDWIFIIVFCFIYCCFIVLICVLLCCCCYYVVQLLLSLSFYLCYLCDLCFWHSLKWYSFLLLSGYSSAVHLLYMFVSFIAIAASFSFEKHIIAFFVGSHIYQVLFSHFFTSPSYSPLIWLISGLIKVSSSS